MPARQLKMKAQFFKIIDKVIQRIVLETSQRMRASGAALIENDDG